MVARYIPSLVVIGVALAAYRLLGIEDMFQKLIETKSLAQSYDYIIGELSDADELRCYGNCE